MYFIYAVKNRENLLENPLTKKGFKLLNNFAALDYRVEIFIYRVVTVFQIRSTYLIANEKENF